MARTSPVLLRRQSARCVPQQRTVRSAAASIGDCAALPANERNCPDEPVSFILLSHEPIHMCIGDSSVLLPDPHHTIVTPSQSSAGHGPTSSTCIVASSPFDHAASLLAPPRCVCTSVSVGNIRNCEGRRCQADCATRFDPPISVPAASHQARLVGRAAFQSLGTDRQAALRALPRTVLAPSRRKVCRTACSHLKARTGIPARQRCFLQRLHSLVVRRNERACTESRCRPPKARGPQRRPCSCPHDVRCNPAPAVLMEELSLTLPLTPLLPRAPGIALRTVPCSGHVPR